MKVKFAHLFARVTRRSGEIKDYRLFRSGARAQIKRTKSCSARDETIATGQFF